MINKSFFRDGSIDHERTSQAVCPHCGEIDESCWEYRGDSGVITCGECEEDFLYEREIIAEYTTAKIEEK